MRLLKTGYLILTIYFLTGCAADLYHLLEESSELPAVSTPVVRSLATAGAIGVSWANDTAADGYKLYRGEAPGGPYSSVYQGQESSYLDRAAEQDRIYYYRLSKLKGEQELEQSPPVAGVAAAFAVSENAGAVPFSGEAAGVVYSYSDGVTELSRSAEYYVDLEPFKGVRVTVEGMSNLGAGELRLVTGDGVQLLNEGDSFVIRNMTVERAPVPFRLEPVGILNRAGSYRLRLLYVVN